MRNKLKQCVVFLLVLVMLSSGLVFGAGSCNAVVDELELHRESARQQLLEYVGNLTVFSEVANRNNISGPAIDRIVEEGKNAITNSQSKQYVDLALSDAKSEIRAIPIIAMSTTTFVLRFPHEDAVFDAVVDYGGLTYTRFAINWWQNVYQSKTVNTASWLTRQHACGAWYFQGLDWMSQYSINFELLQYESGSRPSSSEIEYLLINAQQQAFMDIVIRLNGEIIGYIVVEFYLYDFNLVGTPSIIYRHSLLFSASPRKIDGEFVVFNEGAVRASIEDMKNQLRG